MDPLKNLSTRVTPQSQPARPNQVANNAGGYGFAVDDWARLHRFLILGTEGGTYYVNEKKLTQDNADIVHRLAAADGLRLVKTIVEISEAGRAPRVQPTLYALAVAAAAPDGKVRQAAYDALPRVCRTGTHLFTFAEYVQNQRGWGRGLRRAVANWYTTPPVEKVAYQAVKYRSREGWSHRDLLRLAHPGAEGSRKALFDFICGRDLVIQDEFKVTDLQIVEGFQKVNAVTNAKDAANLIAEYRLPWEAVPDQFLKEPETWDALLDAGIGITALIRNLARLTTLGVIAPLSIRMRWAVETLTNAETLKKGRVHPIQVLDALLTYRQGHGARGKGTWEPVSQIVDALDRAFYLAFGAVQPANKNLMLALDVSGSMSWPTVGGSAVLTPASASAAMALVTAATEPSYHITAFAHELRPVTISPTQRLDSVEQTLRAISFGGTDCSLPMIYARERKIPVDAFVVFTDSETWAGGIHPFQALQQYRQAMGVEARLIVCAMTSTGFSIADPSDALMLDVVGFDTATPTVISDFSAGRI